MVGGPCTLLWPDVVRGVRGRNLNGDTGSPAFSIFPRLFSPNPTLASFFMSRCLGDPPKKC